MSDPQVGDTITTAEEWEALPENALAVSENGRAFLARGVWWVVGLHAPLTIVYLPGQPPRPERVVKAEALREAATHAWVLERATDPTTAAFHWLRGVAHRIERNEP